MIDLFDLTSSSAVLSPCAECPPGRREDCGSTEHRPWRYELRRIWDPTLPLLGWLMLNPSIADAEHGDPTIRRCRGFTELWGYGGFISPDPKELSSHPDPIGPDNDAHLARISTAVAELMCAWGAHPMATRRAGEVLASISMTGLVPKCLGLTKSGHPRHPLYVKASQPLVRLEA